MKRIIASSLVTVLLSGAPLALEEEPETPTTTRTAAPNTDKCPHAERPEKATTTSERLAPGQASPTPLPPVESDEACGTTLPEGGVVVQVSSPSVAIAKVKTTLRKRTVVGGPSAVTVPAGTFTCYTIESQRELATVARVDLTLKSGGREVDFYAPSVGLVKTEYYDKGGKLVQTRVLTKH